MYERKKVNTLATEYEQVLDIYEIDKYGNVYGKMEWNWYRVLIVVDINR